MITERSAEMDAPATLVWDVFTDVERWPAWTASVTRRVVLDGPGIAVGKRFQIKQPKLPTFVWKSLTWAPGSPGPGRSIPPAARPSRIQADP